MPFEIPESWEWTRISCIAELLGGYAFRSNEYTLSGVRIIRISDFDEYGLLHKEYKYTSENDKLVSYEIKPFDILMCMTGGTVGKTCLVTNITGKLYLNQRISSIRNSSLCDTIFLYYCLISPYIKDVIHSSKTSTNDNISMKTIENFLIPVPPHSEQIRIVAKLQELQPYIESYDDVYTNSKNLDASFPDKLKKSILQMAVQGKLVPQDLADEPASVLLERIHEEKQRLIKEGKIKKDKHESIIFRRDNSHYEKRGSEEVCIDDEIPFEIPEGWSWVRLSHISKSIADGDHQPPPQSISGIPFVVISNLSDGQLDMNNTRHVSDDYFSALDNKRIAQRGDILYTVTGSYGLPVVVDTDIPFCFQRHIALIKPLINLKFLFYVLSSPAIKQQADQSATGIAQKTVGIKALSNFFIPLPPEKEQLRIVQALDKYCAIKFSI